jgi:hypothetical protein
LENFRLDTRYVYIIYLISSQPPDHLILVLLLASWIIYSLQTVPEIRELPSPSHLRLLPNTTFGRSSSRHDRNDPGGEITNFWNVIRDTDRKATHFCGTKTWIRLLIKSISYFKSFTFPVPRNLSHYNCITNEICL